MMRTVFAATNSAKRIRTAATISPAMGYLRSIGHERRGALDLDDLHVRADREDLVLVVRAGAPHLALELDGPRLAGDLLEHRRRAPDQRGGARADLRRHRAVAAGDGAHDEERRAGDE